MLVVETIARSRGETARELKVPRNRGRNVLSSVVQSGRRAVAKA